MLGAHTTFKISGECDHCSGRLTADLGLLLHHLVYIRATHGVFQDVRPQTVPNSSGATDLGSLDDLPFPPDVPWVLGSRQGGRGDFKLLDARAGENDVTVLKLDSGRPSSLRPFEWTGWVVQKLAQICDFKVSALGPSCMGMVPGWSNKRGLGFVPR